AYPLAGLPEEAHVVPALSVELGFGIRAAAGELADRHAQHGDAEHATGDVGDHATAPAGVEKGHRADAGEHGQQHEQLADTARKLLGQRRWWFEHELALRHSRAVAPGRSTKDLRAHRRAPPPGLHLASTY